MYNIYMYNIYMYNIYNIYIYKWIDFGWHPDLQSGEVRPGEISWFCAGLCFDGLASSRRARCGTWEPQIGHVSTCTRISKILMVDRHSDHQITILGYPMFTPMFWIKRLDKTVPTTLSHRFCHLCWFNSFISRSYLICWRFSGRLFG